MSRHHKKVDVIKCDEPGCKEVIPADENFSSVTVPRNGSVGIRVYPQGRDSESGPELGLDFCSTHYGQFIDKLRNFLRENTTFWELPE